MKDEDLATRAATGDRAALETLAARHQREIRRWALIGLGRVEAAEDATQEVLLRLVRSIGTFDPNRAFLPWLRTLVRNTVTDQRRSDGRSLPLPFRQPSASIEAQLDARRAIARAEHAFAELTPRQREAYLRCEVQGRRAVDVAAEMEVEPATVRALLHQARRSIRSHALEEVP